MLGDRTGNTCTMGTERLIVLAQNGRECPRLGLVRVVIDR